MLDIVISKQKYMYLNLINSNIVLYIEKDLYFVSFMLKPRKKSPVVKKRVVACRRVPTDQCIFSLFLVGYISISHNIFGSTCVQTQGDSSGEDES